MEGWIKIDRNITSHWLWNNPRQLKWWIDLLIMAAWKDTEVMLGTKVVKLRRGQLAISVRQLCERWTYTGEDKAEYTPSPKTILKFLETLVGSNMVTKTSQNMPNRVTLITICNYDKYQSFEGISDNTLGNTCGNTLGNTCGNTIRRNKEIVDEVNGARVCAYTREGDIPPAETTAKSVTTSPTEETFSDIRQQNKAWLDRYFDHSRMATLESRTKNLHSLNPAISTIEDYRNLARACLDEWELRDDPPKPSFREWSKHLIRHVERKARADRDRNLSTTAETHKLNLNPNPDVTSNPTIGNNSYAEARRRGDDEFARFIAEKLRSAGLS